MPLRRCLAPLLILLSLLGTGAAAAAGLGGSYRADLPGGVLLLRLEQQGNRVTGSMEGPGDRVVLSGVATGTQVRGTASSASGEGAFDAALDGDRLRLTLSQADGPNQRAASIPIEFRRAALPPPGTTAGKAVGGDPRLVGQWIGQTVINSGGASFASEQWVSFGADGTLASGQGRTAAGGAGWSFDGGAGGAARLARWRAEAGILYVDAGDGRWARFGRYGMTEDGRAMRITKDDGGRLLFSRR